jgi:hypothetical protein|tara:strand:+ start:8431 stop:8946 length:516 start_codon:yes stop_codon:yes gene_type:complete
MNTKSKLDLKSAEAKLKKSRGVDPSKYKIEANSTIKTNQSDKSTPRKNRLAQKLFGNKNKSTFSQSSNFNSKQTNVNTGEISTISSKESSTPRKIPLAQKILGNKDIFTEHADVIDSDGNLLFESDRQIKNFGLRRNKEKVKYHDKQSKKDSKAMKALFKQSPELFNYEKT